jgi:hypothetical protein
MSSPPRADPRTRIRCASTQFREGGGRRTAPGLHVAGRSRDYSEFACFSHQVPWCDPAVGLVAS